MRCSGSLHVAAIRSSGWPERAASSPWTKWAFAPFRCERAATHSAVSHHVATTTSASGTSLSVTGRKRSSLRWRTPSSRCEGARCGARGHVPPVSSDLTRALIEGDGGGVDTTVTSCPKPESKRAYVATARIPPDRSAAAMTKTIRKALTPVLWRIHLFESSKCRVPALDEISERCRALHAAEGILRGPRQH